MLSISLLVARSEVEIQDVDVRSIKMVYSQEEVFGFGKRRN